MIEAHVRSPPEGRATILIELWFESDLASALSSHPTHLSLDLNARLSCSGMLQDGLDDVLEFIWRQEDRHSDELDPVDVRMDGI